MAELTVIEQEKLAQIMSTPEAVPLPPPPNPFADYNTEFRIIEEQVPLVEAMKRRRPGFRERSCIVHEGPLAARKFFILDERNAALDYTGSIDLPIPVKVLDILERSNHWSNVCLLILNEEALAKAPKVRRFTLEQTINQTIIELAKAAPENPTLRSHLANIFGVAPPTDARTYQALKDWAEFGFKKPRFGEGLAPKIYAYQDMNPRPVAARELGITRWAFERTAPPGGINVHLVRIRESQGTCRYSCEERKEGDYAIALSLVVEQIVSGRSVDQICQSAIDRARTNCGSWGNPERDNLSYRSYEEQAHGVAVVSADWEAVHQQITEYIRSNYGQEEAQAILGR